ncbi:MAG: DUF5009 domain-containing protein [Bacteroidales bacterium]|nr:DUF5009 domain-containing protein [Bacteroidales bacterium]
MSETTFLDRRNGAIDMLRGLTMFLMVFVNDLWTVGNVPGWIGHTAATQDGMGLADIVFPMFLFSVGMSIPYAIERRFSKGQPGEGVLGHILSRTLALLLMGVFIVNSEGSFSPVVAYGKGTYWALMVLGFFLIWNQYPKEFKPKRWLQAAGLAILLFLALTFRGGDGAYFRAGWWGILGLIGWAYLFCAISWMLSRKKPWIIALLWLAVCLLNMLTTGLRDGGSLIDGGNFISDFARAIHLGNGSCAIMVLGGMMTTLADKRLSEKDVPLRLGAGLGAAILLVLLGWGAHQFWITSKIVGTLPWCLYVSAISVALYTLLRYLERRNWTGWFKPLSPAGTATLTVYMMPYLYYALWVVFSPAGPSWLAGGVGLLKCALFSMLCIATAWLLGKAGLKLKI